MKRTTISVRSTPTTARPTTAAASRTAPTRTKASPRSAPQHFTIRLSSASSLPRYSVARSSPTNSAVTVKNQHDYQISNVKTPSFSSLPSLSSLRYSLVAPHVELGKRFATKKAGGAAKNGRDSNPKYLGLKKGNNQHVVPGQIIARQRGTFWHPWENVGMGKDHTLFAKIPGRVRFDWEWAKRRTYVSVVPYSPELTQQFYEQHFQDTGKRLYQYEPIPINTYRNEIKRKLKTIKAAQAAKQGVPFSKQKREREFNETVVPGGIYAAQNFPRDLLPPETVTNVDITVLPPPLPPSE